MKRLKSSTILATLTALAMLVLSAGILLSQSAQDLYQKALSQEKTQGNLEQAIAIYKKVISGAGADRALAAKAQYHIGLCHEKLGTTEAEKAFRKVIDQYPEQKEPVTAANERLAAITKSQPTSQGTGIVLRQVSIPKGQPSPDGKFFAYSFSHDGRSGVGVNWDYDDIKLYEVATQKEKLITNLSSFKSSGIFSLVWSPDGNGIAFVIQQGNGNSGKLCVVGRDGSNFKIVYDNQALVIDEIAGWLPDETAIVVSIQNKDGSTSIGDLSLQSGVLKEIKNLGKTFGQELSPDGLFVAYEVREGTKFDIRAISRDGTMDGNLVQHPANDTLIGWTPDSRYVLFQSDRSGVRSIWSQKVENGKPAGSPTFMLERGISPMGFTQNGSLYFQEYENRSEVYIAQIDLATGKTLEPPKSIDPSYSGNKYSPVWSPDGTQLGYFIARGTNTRAPSLRIRTIATGKEREFAVDPPTIAFGLPIGWSIAGNLIYVHGTKPVDGKTQGGVYRIDVATGHSELVRGASAGIISPDGTFAMLIKRNLSPSISEVQSSLLRKDIRTGEEKPVVSGQIGEMISAAHVSPDSKWIGYWMENLKDPARPRAFYIVPVEGGVSRQLVPTAEKGAGIGAYFYWGPKDSILFGRRITNQTGNPKRTELRYMPAFDSKQALKLALEMSDISNLTFHPDGTTIAFTSQITETKTWVMENYLPAKK